MSTCSFTRTDEYSPVNLFNKKIINLYNLYFIKGILMNRLHYKYMERILLIQGFHSPYCKMYLQFQEQVVYGYLILIWAVTQISNIMYYV